MNSNSRADVGLPARAGELGYTVGVLGAEGAAARIYQRLGFRRVCTIQPFVLEHTPYEGTVSRRERA